ncbi:MAG TPA: metal ABC transporter permease [Syntrophobacteria bacterium]|nr:metal ABC transporter permease [Syntrophobacteria bacterium]
MEFLEFLHYSFIQRALLAGTLIAVLCSTLGLFLVLRKMSLIADGLSHVSFGAVALSLFLGFYPLYVVIPVVLLCSHLILKLTEKAKVYGDAAIGIASAVGVAGGVILASLSKGFNVDLLSYLFGNILAVSDSEVVVCLVLSLVVFGLVVFFYHDLFSITFDEEYAKITGIKTGRINSILAALTAVTVVLAIRVVGVMLVSALLILPAVSALQVARGFNRAMRLSATISVASVLVGVSVSFLLDLPVGATIVMTNFVIFVLILGYKRAPLPRGF